jgi:hypothetical protein
MICFSSQAAADRQASEPQLHHQPACVPSGVLASVVSLLDRTIRESKSREKRVSLSLERDLWALEREASQLESEPYTLSTTSLESGVLLVLSGTVLDSGKYPYCVPAATRTLPEPEQYPYDTWCLGYRPLPARYTAGVTVHP